EAIYFGCSADSQKAQNLAHDRRVSITVDLPHRTWSDIRGLSLAGRAVEVTDPQELARVGALFVAKFPKLAEFVPTQAGALAIFRVDVEIASVLDYRQGFGAHELIGLSPVHA
ncbi:MAG: pyridoxamine 5'-phosphate oxidase family protein, partial [Proteobacteria bacterium]|nr:pyridoxamine 5'-phosphate oxidase family protein [Pseudomonadota bacterium]